MSAPFQKKIKFFLEKGCEFRIGERTGAVLDVRKEGCVVYWNEWQDPETGECHPAIPGLLQHETIALENDYGKLVVLSRPLAPKRERSAVDPSKFLIPLIVTE